MAINFPDSPTLNQIVFLGNSSYIRNGSAWVGYSTSVVVNYNASSVVVQDNGVVSGASTTLNFGDNLTVLYSSGIATITGSAGAGTTQSLNDVLGVGNTSSRGMSVGVVTATQFIRSGGTSSQFLKADGSVDSNTYLTTTGSAVNLTGLTGAASGTYGSSTVVPVVTVDANGRITGIATSAVTGGGGTGITDGDKGDITVSGTGSTWTIDNDAVTYAKIQNVTSNRILGRSTVGTGDVEEITVGTGLSLSSGTLSGIMPSRAIVNGTTASIAVGATANLTIAGYKSYSLHRVGVSTAAWVVLYCDTASRTADTGRNQTTDPSPGSGVIAEVVTGVSTTVLITPSIVGWNNDATPSTNIYAKVTNLGTAVQTVTVTLTILKLED